MSPTCCSTIWCAGPGATRRASTSRPPPSSIRSRPMPILIEGSRLHLGAIIALIVVVVAAGPARRARSRASRSAWSARRRAPARFAGFNARPADRCFTFADLRRARRASPASSRSPGPVGHLQPSISPGYGFTAIIVAFLGRLNPIGILIAGLFLALTFIGGESAQIALKVPLDLTSVFQGILLFYVLACDTLILYRIRLDRRSRRRPPMGAALEAIILTVHRRLDAAAAGGGRRARRRARRRAQSRRRGHDDHGRGLRLRRRLRSPASTVVGALCGIARRHGAVARSSRC